MSFPTYHQSHKHKEKSGHKRKRAEEAKNDGDKRSKKAKKISAQKKRVKNFFQKKTNKRKVVNISNDEVRKTLMKLRKNVEEENEQPSDEESQDEPCASSDCDIDAMAKTKRTLNWIVCGNCEDWSHTFCVDGSNNKK